MYTLIEVEDMIGKPFLEGGRDLDTGIDCFGLLMECHRRWGKNIPDFRSPVSYAEMEEALDRNKKNGQWQSHWEYGREGSVASLNDCLPGRTLQLLIKGAKCHVAFIYKPGWLVHCWESTNGVTAERINLWKQRIVGIYEFNG